MDWFPSLLRSACLRTTPLFKSICTNTFVKYVQNLSRNRRCLIYSTIPSRKLEVRKGYTAVPFEHFSFQVSFTKTYDSLPSARRWGAPCPFVKKHQTAAFAYSLVPFLNLSGFYAAFPDFRVHFGIQLSDCALKSQQPKRRQSRPEVPKSLVPSLSLLGTDNGSDFIGRFPIHPPVVCCVSESKRLHMWQVPRGPDRGHRKIRCFSPDRPLPNWT